MLKPTQVVASYHACLLEQAPPSMYVSAIDPVFIRYQLYPNTYASLYPNLTFFFFR